MSTDGTELCPLCGSRLYGPAPDACTWPMVHVQAQAQSWTPPRPATYADCAVCRTTMRIVEAGQTTHPGCERA
jgi:hypothetical protein